MQNVIREEFFRFVQARMESGGTNYTQVLIKLTDANDNSPIFEMDKVESYIYENHPTHQPFFAVQAYDKDRGKVIYSYLLCSTIDDNNYFRTFFLVTGLILKISSKRINGHLYIVGCMNI